MLENKEEAVIAFSRWMENERKSHLTVRQYRFFANLFMEFHGKKLEEVTADDIENFKEYMVKERKYSKSSQYLCTKALRLLYRSFRINPPYNLTAPKRPRSVPKYLSEKETARLINAASKNSKNLAIVSVLAYTGIRVGELCRLNIEDVDLDERIMSIRHGKGDKDRIVIISEECSYALASYFKSRNRLNIDNDSLFISRKMCRYDPTSIQRLVKKLSIEAGISKNVTPHILRHTFATSVMRNGANLKFIQEILGHSTLATTQIYVHIDDGAMKSMYEKHKPTYR
ncbi:MAG: tyrosine-type recombinase/integrase [Candidatus Thermoplasmatota archaeon]|nr:tyrosine-type recombinase/integrase [Candidatus Thermoplasmatota archaeon]